MPLTLLAIFFPLLLRSINQEWLTLVENKIYVLYSAFLKTPSNKQDTKVCIDFGSPD